MNLLSSLNRITPIECRLLARVDGMWPTNQLISVYSGLPTSTIRRLSELTSWAGVTVEEATKFSHGCGVDLLHPRRSIDYINRRSFAHLKCNPRYRDKLVGILRDFRNSQQS